VAVCVFLSVWLSYFSQEFCFVTYVNFLQAERALKIFNQSALRGQALRAEPAKQRDASSRSDTHAASSSSGGGGPSGGVSLHVRNLSRRTTRESLLAHFEVCGKVREARVPPPRDGEGHNAGFGFVEFEDPETAAKALARMAHTILDGATIEVCFSKSKNAPRRDQHDGGGRSSYDNRGGDRYDDRSRGGYGRDDRRGGYDPYGRGAPPMMGGYGMPYMYPPAMMQQMAAMMSAAAANSSGGRGGAGGASGAAGPYGAYAPYMAPYMAAMAAAGGRAPVPGAPSSSSRDGSASTTAFPPAAGAYGLPPGASSASSAAPGGYDPRYAAMYAQMMASQAAAAAAAGGSSSSSKRRRSSRSKSSVAQASRPPCTQRSPARLTGLSCADVACHVLLFIVFARPGRRRDRSSSPSRSRSRSRDRKRR
jgi:RNA recognition motif-containing protein